MDDCVALCIENPFVRPYRRVVHDLKIEAFRNLPSQTKCDGSVSDKISIMQLQWPRPSVAK
jgi:hypothetical protein